MNNDVKMKVYRFQVSGAGSEYVLYVQDLTLEDATDQAQEIAGEKRTLACTLWTPGTLDEFMGDEYHERIIKRRAAQKRSSYKQVKRAQAVEARNVKHA